MISIIYQQSRIGVVWFCKLKTNPVTVNLFIYHHGTGPRFLLSVVFFSRAPSRCFLWQTNQCECVSTRLSAASVTWLIWPAKNRPKQTALGLIAREVLWSGTFIHTKLLHLFAEIGCRFSVYSDKPFTNLFWLHLNTFLPLTFILSKITWNNVLRPLSWLPPTPSELSLITPHPKWATLSVPEHNIRRYKPTCFLYLALSVKSFLKKNV